LKMNCPTGSPIYGALPMNLGAPRLAAPSPKSLLKEA